jgi:hypothetical protein
MNLLELHSYNSIINCLYVEILLNRLFETICFMIIAIKNSCELTLFPISVRTGPYMTFNDSQLESSMNKKIMEKERN